VEPSHLADFDLYDFKHLSQAKEEDEDPMFDHEKFSSNEMALTIATQNEKHIAFARKPFPVAVTTEE
jgi:tRNA 2-thiocytidine biosynthesis protein TtcA